MKAIIQAASEALALMWIGFCISAGAWFFILLVGVTGKVLP